MSKARLILVAAENGFGDLPHIDPDDDRITNKLPTPDEVCIDSLKADRAPGHRYRAAPLAGLFTHQKGGLFHYGRFATLNDVVNHYDRCFSLGLTDQEKNDLIQYLLSL